MAVSTVDEYLSALEKSKLLGSEQLVEAQRLAGASSNAADLAKSLAREKLVSRWQAGTLLALGQRAQLRLGKYKLIQRLGKGGMGTVFLAEHVTMNRRVALKIVPRLIAEDRASLDRFFAEARAIAALDHPNIVRAYSVDNEMDRYFIVMEFVDGQDLQRLVELNGPLEIANAADYIGQAAEGLAHAHARNLVHCDIKPSNLLVTSQGVIKILDLGLARLKQGDEPRRTAAGESAFGTVDYMAPEQAMESSNFDHRADIYSLGGTLYFLLTGHPPFPEGTLAQRIVKHQTQEPRDILLERPNVPPALVEICKRMMAKAPEGRYQSIQEVSNALAPWRNASDGVTGANVPRSVKPLNDSSSAVIPADDWLSFLAAPATSNSGSNSAKAIAAARSTRSGKQQGKNGQQRRGIAAALAGASAFASRKLAWFNTTKRKVLGAIGGAVLLAAIAGIGTLPLLLHAKPQPQAVARPKVEEKNGPIEEDVGSASKTSGAGKTDVPQGLPGKTPEGNPVATKKPELPPEKPKEIVPPKPPEPVKPAPQSPNKTDVVPDTKSGPSPAVNPAQPAKPPEPPSKPTVPAKPVSLDGLAAAVDLPQPGKGANDAVSLGKLDLDPKQLVDIRMLGGDSVAKGNPKFELQKDSGEATPGWSIQSVEKNKDAVKIARVWPAENEWKIQWTAAAKDKATLVRYCGLEFSCETKTHFVALSTPKTVPPLPIDLDTGSARARLSKEIPLPDVAVLRLQILPLDKSMPNCEVKVLESKGRTGRPVKGKPAELAPGNTVPIKGHVVIVVTKEKTPRVHFNVGFDTRGRDLILDLQAEITASNAPFNLANLQATAARVGAWLMVNDSDKNPHRPPKEQIEAMKTTRDQLKALGDLVAELNQKASIPFRVYVVLGDTDREASPKVVIFQSGQFEPPKPGGAKKNPKGNKSKGRGAPGVDDLKL
jgi:serine/threonine protein kinase